MTAPDPQFPLALRGYARAAVDAWVARLPDQLAQARAEGERQGRAQAEREHEPRVRAALEQAVERAVAQALAAERDRTAQEQQQAVDAAVTAALAAERRHATTPLPRSFDSAPLAHPRPPGSHRRRAWWVPGGAAVLVLAALGTVAALAARPGPAVSPAAQVDPSPSAALPAAAAAARAQPRLGPAVVPRGWHVVRAGDGSWSLALPPGWTGTSRALRSAAGLATASVRTAAAAALPTAAELTAAEYRFAAAHPGYRRVTLGRAPFRGQTAVVWEFAYGHGAGARHVWQAALAVSGRSWELRLQAPRAAWRTTAPVAAGLRSSWQVVA